MSPPLFAAAAGDAGAPAFLSEVAALLVVAAVAAFGVNRLRQVPIIGFLLAGVLIGPNAFALVESIDTVNAAAEIGVILLLFTIGLEFSTERLIAIRRLIVGGGGAQVGLAIAVTAGICLAVGTTPSEAVFTGMLVALSSTAIVLKMLEERGGMQSASGRVQLGLLIFQDLAIVGFIVLVPLLGGAGSGPLDIALVLGRAVLAVGAILAGGRVMPWVLERVARTCSREVFLLVVVAICMATAYLTGLLIGSVTLGAFLAGLLIGDSAFDLQALGDIDPLQTLFSAVFFVSVGMLLDPAFLVANLPLVVGVVLLVAVIKLVTTAVAGRLLGQSWPVTVTAAFGLAQIGEFSFVLNQAGTAVGLSPAGLGEDGSQVFIAATVLLMVATPALTGAGSALAGRVAARHRQVLEEDLGAGPDALVGHVVIAGYGTAARRLAGILERSSLPFLITTLSPTGATEAEERGYRVLRADATRVTALEAAGLMEARCLVVADDEPEMVARIAAGARRVAPGVPVIARIPGDGEAGDLGVSELVTVDEASSLALGVRVLRHYGLANQAIAAEVERSQAGGWTGGVTQAALSMVDDRVAVDFRPVREHGCGHIGTIRPVVPSAPGCEDCLRIGARWVHLRVCLQCGHVGCCDSSPNRHASVHHATTGHPIVASGEEGEHWAWCFVDQVRIDGAAAPTGDQPDVTRPTGGDHGARRP